MAGRLGRREVIRNAYDSGGNLQSIHGRLNGAAYDYLQRLDYDRFESRLYLVSGNGMETKYSYDPANRRLSRLHSGSPAKNALQDLAYGYDPVGNITTLNDRAPIPRSNEYGGQSSQNFYYDDLYRLVKADGTYTTAREVQTYALGMAYDEIHNITHKSQTHTVAKNGGTPRIERATSYDWAYAYGQRQHKQPHAPTQIGNRTFDYDANGNQTGWQNLDNGTRRTIVWDEDNRIREVQDPKHGAAFTYDDQGERKLKKSQYGETAYITQFFTVRNGAIASTHVYAGTSRIATKLGAGTPVGKVTNGGNTKGTGNLSTADASLTEYVAPDGEAAATTTTTTATTAATIMRPRQRQGQGKAQAQGTKPGQGAGQAKTDTHAGAFPGQGLEQRSERANEVARNTEKNKHLNGGNPGGEQGSVNSNAGGNNSNAGGNGNTGNAWGRTGERGNSGHLNNGQGGQGQGNAGGQGQGSANGNGGGNAGNGGGSATGGSGGTGGTGDGREFVYFYHPDHLGSSAYVTDEKANRYEHLAYFPFGETWVQESTATWRVPYQYTSKEMDQETGLYYFGARYYDPRTSVWQSADPIFGKYLDGKAGQGGVFNTLNLGVYSYGHLQPITILDPDGNQAQKYFVIHQTVGSQPMGLSAVQALVGRSGHAHSYIMPDGKVIQVQPYGNPKGWATRQESPDYVKQAGGGYLAKREQMVAHVELNYGTNGSPTEEQYAALAKEYVNVAKQFGNVAIVSHREVDRGISGAHEDPHNFDFEKFYGILKGMGVDVSKIDRLTQERHDKRNQADQKVNWPPVLSGRVERKPKPDSTSKPSGDQ